MLGRSHLAAGAIAGETVAAVAHAHLGGLGLGAGVGMLSGWLPDVDKVGSGVSRSIPLGWLPGLILKHRGVTHTAAAAGLWWLWWHRWVVVHLDLPPWAAAAALAGYVSHLVLDMATDGGIAPLWPVWRRKLGLGLHTGGLWERAAASPALVAALAWCTWVWR